MNSVAENVNQLQIIKQVAKPSILLDEMSVIDTEYGTNQTIGPDNQGPVKYTKAVAGDMPLVYMNKVYYRGVDIVSMRIYSTDFLPRLDLTLLIRNKVVYSTSFPKDGDIVSIFVRSKDDLLKPIRNDYYITSVRIDSSRNETGYDNMYIAGILYVPGMNSQKCQFNSGKSIDVLHKISQELQIGFATNETDTSDDQTWISPYQKKIDYVKEISNSAWKNEDSFFKTFIDVFYHLNFVNVDPLFSLTPGFELGVDMQTFSSDYDDFMELMKHESNIMLTNSSSAKFSKFRIANYEQKNFANAINFHAGYMKYMHYYDSLLKEKIVFLSDPKTTPGAEKDKYLLRGRNAEDQKDMYVSHDWMGTVYGANGENCHSKYLYAKSWNYQNLLHLQKLSLDVTLEGVNMNLRRFQVIPVLIVIERDQSRKQANQTEESDDKSGQSQPDQDSLSVDKFYSGFYVIDAIEYIYEKGLLKQKLTLLRREWPVPPNKK